MSPQDPAQHALDEQRQEAERADEGKRQRQHAQDREPGYSGSQGAAVGPDDDPVDEASAESFPASDPPAWMPDSL